MNISSFIKTGKKLLIKRSPEILIAVGVASMISATFLAIKSTPKAMEVLDSKKDEELKPIDKVKILAPIYAPTAVALASGTACIIFSSRITAKRTAALAAAYSISETTLSRYMEKVAEKYGKETVNDIRKEVVEEQMTSNPPEKVIQVQKSYGNSRNLFYEPLSGRYFESSTDFIDKAVNNFNRQMRCENRLSINDWFGYLGLDSTDLGDMLGWDIDKGYIDIHYSAKLREDNVPTVAIIYALQPEYIGW